MATPPAAVAGELDELWVPVLDGEVVGFAHVGRELLEAVPEAGPMTAGFGERGELHGLYLHPSVWGTGVASALIEHCHGRLATCFDEAVLWVIAANERARRFYERSGWSAGSGDELIEDLWSGPQMSGMPPFGPPVADIQYRRRLAQRQGSRPMELRLDGKVALVTGASKGIGKAIAKAYADAGASVMLSSRKADQLEAAVAEIGGDTAYFAANAGDLAAAEACVAATIERFGGLDILVNNAATNPYNGPTLGVDEGRYDKTMQVNLKGPVFWTQVANRLAFEGSDGGKVVLNIASVGGLRAEATLGVYNLTKAALIHFTRHLAAELGPTVRAVGIAPGLVKTDFAKWLVDNFGESLERSLPMRRLGEPEDIANLALFLVSDKASWITGETYVIDGGAGVRSS